MLPYFSFDNRPNQTTGNMRILSGNLELLKSVGEVQANGNDFCFREFAERMPFATIACSMPDTIFSVIFSSSPTKIGQAVVVWIAVVMTALHSFRARTDESSKYEGMNQENTRSAFFVQSNGAVAKLVSYFPTSARLQAMPFITYDGIIPLSSARVNQFQARPNATIVADAIPRVSRYVSVLDYLRNVVEECRLNLGHASLRERGVLFGGWCDNITHPFTLPIRVGSFNE